MQAMVADAKSVQLDLSSRGIETLEITEVAAGKVERLDASRNRLRSLLGSQLQQLTSLQQLDLSHNRQLSDVSGLMLLPQLRVLNLARNKLQNLQALQGLTQLEQLDVHSNSITSLVPLSTLTSLSSINAAANQLQELPDLSALSFLTQLNLRHNHITHLTASDGSQCRTSPTPAAGAAGADDGHAARCPADCRSNNRQCAGSNAMLPCSLRRLSLSCNQLQDVSTLTALQQLPNLLDLCVDGNPFTAADRQPHSAAAGGGGSSGTRCAGNSGSSSSTCWYRDAVLAAACTPSLLMLDGQPVSQAERSLLLHSAAKLSAISKNQQLQELDRALTSHAYSRPLQRAGGGDPAGQGQGAPGSVAAVIEQAEAAVAAATQQDMEEEEGPSEEHEQVCVEQQQQAQFDSLTSSMCDLELQTGSERPWQHLHVQQQQQQQQQQQRHQDLADTATAAQPPTPPPLQQRPQQLALQYQGSLRQAAVSCGIDVDEVEAVDAIRQPAGQLLEAGRGPQLPAGEAATAARDFRLSPTAAGSGVSAGVNGGNDDDAFGVFMDDAEVEEYLQVEKARLLTRKRASPPPPSPPPETPGMELHGSRCVLTGNVLHLLKAEAVAALSDLTLAHVAYAEVLDAFSLLMGFKRLRSLSLVNNKGLATLPQLHPLLQLRKLSHLTLKDSPICSLVLLQPYVAFRFSSLQSFNGQALTVEDRSAAGVVFGGLEAALDAALDEAPQQAALAAAGIQVSAGPMHHQHTRPSYDDEQPGRGQQQPGNLNPAGVEPSTGGTSAPMAPLSGTTAAAAVTRTIMGLDALHTGSTPSTAPVTSSGRVSRVFAAMRGPLLPPPAVMEQGRQFAQQLLREAAVVQQQLAEFEEVTWPALIEQSIHEAWSGHPSGAVSE